MAEVQGYLRDVTGRLVDMLGPVGGANDNKPLDPVSTYLHTYGRGLHSLSSELNLRTFVTHCSRFSST
jgi:hypothetical protein